MLLIWLFILLLYSYFLSLIDLQLVMPEDALVGAWMKSAHKLWVKRLRRTSSLSELLQVLFCCSLDIIVPFGVEFDEFIN